MTPMVLLSAKLASSFPPLTLSRHLPESHWPVGDLSVAEGALAPHPPPRPRDPQDAVVCFCPIPFLFSSGVTFTNKKVLFCFP